MPFSQGFIWGAATAAYQIEGTARAAGGGDSVWDMFCRKPGAVWNGESGNIACDHYQRFTEDIALMQELGIKAYRFSLSWPRILPTGVGQINEQGLDFYDRLVDALLAVNITPYVTLFHWDFPYDLYCRGGWLNRDSADWFAEYTRIVVNRLGDRVQHWMTLNEPQCFIGLGHQSGQHAPGDTLGLSEVLRTGHHALLAHGKAVQTLRTYAKQACQIGYAPVGVVKLPAAATSTNIDAARQAMFSITETSVWNNTWWLDPIFFGRYPEDGLRTYGAAVPQVRDGDMATISQSLDFLGANIYNGQTVRADGAGQPIVVPHVSGIGRTTYGWPVTPPALYWGPRFFWERYHTPIVITENGVSTTDWIALDGKVHDPQRIDFLQRYLLECERAQDDGVDIRAYFHWSLLDNFEWHEGYKQRFGLVYVDYATQKRVPKDSAFWYRDVIQSNGAHLHVTSDDDAQAIPPRAGSKL